MLDRLLDTQYPVKPFLMMLIVFGLRMVDTSDPTFIHVLRVLFISSNVVAFLALAFLYWRVTSRNDPAPVSVLERDMYPDQHNFMTRMADPTSGTATIRTTVAEYDLSQLRTMFNAQSMAPFIVFAIHLYWGFVPPLALQAIHPLLNVFGSNLARFYLWAHVYPLPTPLPSHLRRPWTSPSFMDKIAEMQNKAGGGAGSGSSTAAPLLNTRAAIRRAKIEEDKRKNKSSNK